MSTGPGDAITAHGGGVLVDLKPPAADRGAIARHAEGLKTIRLSARDLADLEMLASGAFSPLEGFMGEAGLRALTRRDAPGLRCAVVDPDNPWSRRGRGACV
jgi:hypothetical protein